MKRARVRSFARAVAGIAAITLATSAGLLVRDYAQTIYQGPRDKAKLDKLESEASQDLSLVAKLDSERERQTRAAQLRVRRQKIHTLVIAVAAVLFLASAKWLLASRNARPPRLKFLRKLRQPQADASMSPERPARRRRSEDHARNVPPPAGAGGNGEFDTRFLDSVVTRHGTGREAAIPILQAIQSQYRFLPKEALQRVCKLTEVTPAQIAGVSSFYAQFRTSPMGRHLIRVCHGTACHVLRATDLSDEIRRRLDLAPDADTDGSGEFTVETVACLGCCSLAPVIMVDEDTFGKLSPTTVGDRIERFRKDSEK